MDIFGTNIIKDKLKNTPHTSGVYKMIDKNNKILYIGKAKDLFKRLNSYTQLERVTDRIKLMINQVYDVEVINTESELQALIIEASLIKSLQPKYNILLKDDKQYPYIIIKTDHCFPQILKYRKNNSLKNGLKNKCLIYGPFASSEKVNETINYLQKIFLLRTCSDSYFSSRKLPCVQYQIKRCSAPCVGKISKEEYNSSVQKAENFLRGDTNKLQQDLLKEMEEASIKTEYEKAAKYRDQIRSLAHIQMKQNIFIDIDEADIVSIDKYDDISCVQLFMFRAYQNYGNKCFFIENTRDMNINEVFEGFIGQYYQGTEKPKELITDIIISNKRLLENAFGLNITIPFRGNKLAAVKFVAENAKQSLKRRLQESINKAHLFDKIAEIFNLTAINSIEIFDNSHISGSYAIGAMVVANKDGFDKGSYRKFNINTTTKGDDYQMLREVLNRRYKNITDLYPSLILIDGGIGHMSVAKEVFLNLGLDLNYACIAKGEKRNAGGEKLILKTGEIINLSNDDEIMKFLQNLRDEAHRFAITTHRKKREKSIRYSQIDDIPYIGTKRKKNIISHFGSLKNLTAASLQDIEQVPYISKKLAFKIYQYLGIMKKKL